MKGLRHIIWDTGFGSWRGVLANFGVLSFYVGMSMIPFVQKLILQVEDAKKSGDESLVELIQMTGTADIYSTWNVLITGLLSFLSGIAMRGELKSGTLTLVITRTSRGTYYLGTWLGVLLIAVVYLAVGLIGYICLSLYFTSEISINIFALIASQAVKLIVLISGAFLLGLLSNIPKCQIGAIILAVCFVGFRYIPYLEQVPHLLLSFLSPASLGEAPATLIYSSAEFPWDALTIVAIENILYALTLTLIGTAVFERIDIPSRRTD